MPFNSGPLLLLLLLLFLFAFPGFWSGFVPWTVLARPSISLRYKQNNYPGRNGLWKVLVTWYLFRKFYRYEDSQDGFCKQENLDKSDKRDNDVECKVILTRILRCLSFGKMLQSIWCIMYTRYSFSVNTPLRLKAWYFRCTDYTPLQSGYLLFSVVIS